MNDPQPLLLYRRHMPSPAANCSSAYDQLPPHATLTWALIDAAWGFCQERKQVLFVQRHAGQHRAVCPNPLLHVGWVGEADVFKFASGNVRVDGIACGHTCVLCQRIVRHAGWCHRGIFAQGSQGLLNHPCAAARAYLPVFKTVAEEKVLLAEPMGCRLPESNGQSSFCRLNSVLDERHEKCGGRE